VEFQLKFIQFPWLGFIDFFGLFTKGTELSIMFWDMYVKGTKLSSMRGEESESRHIVQNRWWNKKSHYNVQREYDIVQRNTRLSESGTWIKCVMATRGRGARKRVVGLNIDKFRELGSAPHVLHAVVQPQMVECRLPSSLRWKKWICKAHQLCHSRNLSILSPTTLFLAPLPLVAITHLIHVPDSDNLVFLWTMSYSLWTL
jgi:hypothetical protein